MSKYMFSKTYRVLNTSREMKSEDKRFRSFGDEWKMISIRPCDLARSGFYYFENGVKCAFCGLHVKEWNLGDDPQTKHIELSPRCRFVNGFYVGNKPLLNFRIIDEANPMNMKLKECRLDSFRRWPHKDFLPPNIMSESGLFYTGELDIVQCIYCHGYLGNWKKGDNPISEHAKFYPRCKNNKLREKVEIKKLVGKNIHEALQCNVCLENERVIVFLPCAHLSCCELCAKRLNHCVVCRVKISSCLRIYVT